MKKKQDVINFIIASSEPPRKTVTYTDLLSYIGFSNGDKLVRILKELIEEGSIIETDDEEYQVRA
jgi:hypothetical protein